MGGQFSTLLECTTRDREPQDEPPPPPPPPETAAATPQLPEQSHSDGRLATAKERIKAAEKAASRRMMKALRRVMTLHKQLSAIVCYFLVGYIYYSAARGWNSIQCLLFSVEVIMSVGYGDLLPPATNSALLFTCGYILCGIAIIAMIIAQIFDSIVSGSVAELLADLDRLRANAIRDMCCPDDSAIFQQDSQTTASSEWWRKCREMRRYLFHSVLCLAVGMAGFGWLDHSGQIVDRGLNHLNPFVRALYFSVVTLTTVGFGDAFPVTPWSMCFSSVFMVVGIPTFGYGLAKVAGCFTENESEPAKLIQISKLDKSKLATLVEFESDLHDMCRLGGRDGRIDQCEYMAFVLVRNGVVSMDTLKDIIDGFNKLDKDGNGKLSVHDLQE